MSKVKALRMGQRGEDVRQWQELLRREGFNVAIDGVFGPETRAATLAFQRQTQARAQPPAPRPDPRAPQPLSQRIDLPGLGLEASSELVPQLGMASLYDPSAAQGTVLPPVNVRPQGPPPTLENIAPLRAQPMAANPASVAPPPVQPMPPPEPPQNGRQQVADAMVTAGMVPPEMPPPAMPQPQMPQGGGDPREQVVQALLAQQAQQSGLGPDQFVNGLPGDPDRRGILGHVSAMDPQRFTSMQDVTRWELLRKAGRIPREAGVDDYETMPPYRRLTPRPPEAGF